MPTARRARRRSLPSVISSTIVTTLLLFAFTAVAVPGPVLGATVTKAAACGANLRTSPYTTARLRVTIRTNTKVTVVASVAGGRWKATCAGRSVAGRYWYRITAINGKSVRTLYGVRYLYAATGLFKPVPAPAPAPVTKYAACNVYLRASASTTATATTLIKADTKVTVVSSVTGSSWSTTCADTAVSGTSWYRISAVNDTSVQSLYGVSYVYAASGLFSPTPTATATPTPTPTPTPEATPLTTAPTPSPTPTPTPATTTEGIDASHWQGTIDWTAVRGAGKRFAFLKASEDTWYVDPTYATNRAQAQAVGMYVGAYHFAQPNATPGSATAQADHFLDTATPVSGDLRPVLDLERSGGLAQTALIDWVREYLQRVYDRLGVRAVIYCSPNFWRNYMSDTTWFADNGYEILWIAHWTTAAAPSVPANAWSGNDWTFWQYTSDGSVPGISGRVDLDRYNGTDFTRVRIP